MFITETIRQFNYLIAAPHDLFFARPSPPLTCSFSLLLHLQTPLLAHRQQTKPQTVLPTHPKGHIVKYHSERTRRIQYLAPQFIGGPFYFNTSLWQILFKSFSSVFTVPLVVDFCIKNRACLL